MKGKLIVLDGTDGSGKATQTKLLCERLREDGRAVETVDFPRYGEKSAGLVEEYLNLRFGDPKKVGPYRASIFYACDRYAASFEIRRMLEDGSIVIANRYVSSNMGHQAGKIRSKKERDKFLKWLEELEYGLFKIPRPDKTILLYMPPDMGQQLVDRKGHRDYVGCNRRDAHESDLQHLKDAARAYLYVAKKFRWEVIDCAPKRKLRNIEDISEEVWAKVKTAL